MTNQSPASNIICIGEVLWDSLPVGLFLGGAPLNVGFHLHELNEHVSVVSRVGDDRLGKEALTRIRFKGLETGLIQTDEQYETGFVQVQVDEDGNPDYEIIAPVAWDEIALTDTLREEADKAWAMVFGTLAQRNAHTRATIEALYDSNCLKIFDINLRKPFDDREVVQASLEAADIVKLNEAELQQLITWFELEGESETAVRSLANKFECDTICVTQGGKGAMLLHKGKWTEQEGYKIQVADAVGAGDAFLAALINGIRKGKDNEELLRFANAAGALVASKYGATPEYGMDEIMKIAG